MFDPGDRFCPRYSADPWVQKSSSCVSSFFQNKFLKLAFYVLLGQEFVDLSGHEVKACFVFLHAVKMNMVYLIDKIVATDYKQYY